MRKRGITSPSHKYAYMVPASPGTFFLWDHCDVDSLKEGEEIVFCVGPVIAWGYNSRADCMQPIGLEEREYYWGLEFPDGTIIMHRGGTFESLHAANADLWEREKKDRAKAAPTRSAPTDAPVSEVS